MTILERRSLITALLAGFLGVSPKHPFADSIRSAVKVAADEDRFGKGRAIGHNSTTFKVATRDTQGALFMMEQRSKEPGGPPLHLHHQQDEFWFVISGEYEFQIDSVRYQAKPGDCLLGPRGIPHAYAFVAPSSEGRILIGFTPAGRIEE